MQKLNFLFSFDKSGFNESSFNRTKNPGIPSEFVITTISKQSFF